MDFMPDEETPPPHLPRLGRLVLVAILGAAVLLGGATVLARPHSAASAAAPAPVHPVAPAAFQRLANAGTDTGPGEAESELAILPQTRQ